MWVRGLAHSCAAPSSLLMSLPKDVEMAGECDAQRWKEQRLSQTWERWEQETDGEDSGKEGRSWELNAVILPRFQQKTLSWKNTTMGSNNTGKDRGAFRTDNCPDNFINIMTNVALVWLRCFRDGVCTNINFFQVASRKPVMSHKVIIQFAFLLPAENFKQLPYAFWRKRANACKSWGSFRMQTLDHQPRTHCKLQQVCLFVSELNCGTPELSKPNKAASLCGQIEKLNLKFKKHWIGSLRTCEL